jgi:hypothetical protein
MRSIFKDDVEAFLLQCDLHSRPFNYELAMFVLSYEKYSRNMIVTADFLRRVPLIADHIVNLVRKNFNHEFPLSKLSKSYEIHHKNYTCRLYRWFNTCQEISLDYTQLLQTSHFSYFK